MQDNSTTNNTPPAAVEEKAPVLRVRTLTIILIVLLLAGGVELLIARGMLVPGADGDLSRLDTSLSEPAKLTLSDDEQRRVLVRRSAEAAVFAPVVTQRIAGHLNGRAVVPPFEITVGNEPAEPATLAGAVAAGLHAAALQDLLQWNALCDASSKEPATESYLMLVQRFQIKKGDVWTADHVLFFERTAFVRLYPDGRPESPVIFRLRQEGPQWLFTFAFEDEEAANVVAAALVKGAIAE